MNSYLSNRVRYSKAYIETGRRETARLMRLVLARFRLPKSLEGENAAMDRLAVTADERTK